MTYRAPFGFAAALLALSFLPTGLRADGPDARPAVVASRPAARPVAPMRPAASAATKFLRFVDDGHDGGRLETSIVTYRNKAGITVRLVAAVHVGERAYYQGLAKTFAGYDALLYEMVKPKDMGPPRPGEKTGSGVSAFQRWLKDTLELEFQLDAIDYRAANFVHADLDAETFARMQAERGESILKLMVQTMLDQMANEMAGTAQHSSPPPTIVDLLAALGSPDRARQLKLLLARQFNDIEASLSGMTGPEGSVLVTERNKAALRALAKTIGAGKKDLAVFYGAAHMPDLEQRLLAMGFAQQGPVEWRTAWDLVDPHPSADPPLTPLEKILRTAEANRAAAGKK